MSAPAQTPEGTKSKPDRRARRERARTAGAVILAVLITVFAVLNLQTVKVHAIFGTWEPPLIVVIAVSVLVGAVIALAIEHRPGRRHSRH